MQLIFAGNSIALAVAGFAFAGAVSAAAGDDATFHAGKGVASIAIFVESSSGTMTQSTSGVAVLDALEGRLGEHGAAVVGAATIRAARAFLELPNALDEVSGERVRVDLGVERLVSIAIRPEESVLFVRVRVFDPGKNRQFFRTATSGTLEMELDRALFGERTAEPGPTGAPDIATPTAAPATPEPSPTATPIALAPSPTPSATASPVLAPRLPAHRVGEKKGSVELGVLLGYASESRQARRQGNKSQESASDLLASPVIGWVPFRDVELVAQPSVRFVTGGKSGSTSAGIAVGALYFFNLGNSISVGPRVTAGLLGSRGRVADGSGGSLTFEESGTTASLGVVTKLPVSQSVVLTMEMSGYAEITSQTFRQGALHATGSETRSGLRTSVGVSFWNWPAGREPE